MPPFRLYIISDEQMFPGKLESHLPAMLRHGSFGLQIREKTWTPDQVVRHTEKILQKAPPGIPFYCYLNDRTDLAFSLQLHGIQLREDSLSLSKQHPFFKQTLSFGVSTHSLEGIQRAEAGGADFVTYGPVFETPSKQSYGAPLGLASLEEVSGQTKIPIFAIGGITHDRIGPCLQAGAFGVALISAIWSDEDPANAVLRASKEIIRSRILLRADHKPLPAKSQKELLP